MNNMTGDPNQANRPTVFGFEPYPSLNVQPIDWSRIPLEPPSPAISPGQFHSGFPYQYSHMGLGSLTFCSSQTPHPAQFPFPNSNQHGQFGSPPSSSSSIRCKRKTDSPPLQLCKQHITEEKMAEHMAKLHISSETAASSRETDRDRTRRLYMCEEMRKLQNDSILPQSLLSQIHRPCTALVLWSPPRRLIPLENDDSESTNNNEEVVPDHNAMAVENDVNNMDLDNA